MPVCSVARTRFLGTTFLMCLHKPLLGAERSHAWVSASLRNATMRDGEPPMVPMEFNKWCNFCKHLTLPGRTSEPSDVISGPTTEPATCMKAPLTTLCPSAVVSMCGVMVCTLPLVQARCFKCC